LIIVAHGAGNALLKGARFDGVSAGGDGIWGREVIRRHVVWIGVRVLRLLVLLLGGLLLSEFEGFYFLFVYEKGVEVFVRIFGY
jgi:hypothetical protein